MPKFLILPIETPDTFEAMSPQQMQRIVDKYVRWTQSLARKKRLVSGEKLANDGRVVRGTGSGMMVTDGPHTEAKELIGGFWIIEADSYEEAVKLCEDSPHLDFGTIVVRQIEGR